MKQKIFPAEIELDRDTSQAGYMRIVTHLTTMDKEFIPIRSDRVDIQSQCHLLKMQLHPTWHGQLLLPLT